MFHKIKDERSCTKIGIPPEYCACENSIHSVCKKLAAEIIEKFICFLNQKVEEHNRVSNTTCREFEIREVTSISRYEDNVFQAMIRPLPGGIFESTAVGNNKNGEMEIEVKFMQRIDAIGKYYSEKCPVEKAMLEYCFCL